VAPSAVSTSSLPLYVCLRFGGSINCRVRTSRFVMAAITYRQHACVFMAGHTRY
jgi:hypothetical protein